MRKEIIYLLFFISNVNVFAQTIHGKVTDAETHKALDMATVVWERNGTPLNYVLTDQQGNYTIKHSDLQDKDILSVNYLGYEKQNKLLKGHDIINFSLTPQTFTLKEVEIKGGRVFGRQDTTRYDISRFISERDNTLKDALKKLPGIDINKNGTISYNGKDISRFTIEGMDLTGGHYNLINENLKAKDVDKAEIIDHFQHIRSLAQKIHSDDIALNIKLKPEVKNKWIYTLKALSGLSNQKNSVLWNENTNALQIGKQKQCLYGLQIDNTGKDLEAINRFLIEDGNETNLLNHKNMPSWLTQPTIDSPIEEERLRFNRTYGINLNQIQAKQSEKEIRFSANYLHNELNQQTSSNSIFHLNDNKSIETNEKQKFYETTDHLQTEFFLEKNRENLYLKEQMTVNGQLNNSHSYINTNEKEIEQFIHTPSLSWKNELKSLQTKGHQTLSFHSSTQLVYSPAELNLGDDKEYIHTTRNYSDNSFNWMQKKGFISQQYSVGLCIEDMLLHNHHWTYSLYSHPQWEYKKGQFNLQINSLFQWKRFCKENKSYLLISPQIVSTLKTGFHHEWSAFGCFLQEISEWTYFLPNNYRKDYRTWYENTGIIPRNNLFSTNLEYKYKHPLHELFWSVQTGYSILKKNLLSNTCLNNGLYNIIQQEKNNRTYNWTIKNSISKSWFGLHLKLSCITEYLHSKGLCMTNGSYIAYTSNQLSLEPKIIFSPIWGELEYNININYNRFNQENNTDQSKLWNWVQNLSFTKTIGKIDIRMNTSYYRNDLYSGETSYLTLADATIIWRMKKIRLCTGINNLFNKKEYSYTINQNNITETHSFNLRPREWTFSVQCNL